VFHHYLIEINTWSDGRIGPSMLGPFDEAAQKQVSRAMTAAGKQVFYLDVAEGAGFGFRGADDILRKASVGLVSESDG
jgi:hypothetical protein